MGPHVFACGNYDYTGFEVFQALELQWGRTFLRAEIRRSRRGRPPGRRFNGAARFCVRKSYRIWHNRMWRLALQWGRTFLRAEIRGRGRAPASGARFNGAARFCVRKCRREPIGVVGAEASMGPHVFACGNLSERGPVWYVSAASMGPHVFACGNYDYTGFEVFQALELQWGRTFLRAEIRRSRRGRPPGRRFNGAARFCVRKSYRIWHNRMWRLALQWGRTFLRAEIRGRGRAPASGARFNGAARFCVRKCRREPIGVVGAEASMGPHA